MDEQVANEASWVGVLGAVPWRSCSFEWTDDTEKYKILSSPSKPFLPVEQRNFLEEKYIPLENKGFLVGEWNSHHFLGSTVPGWIDPTPTWIEPWYLTGCRCPLESLRIPGFFW